MYTSTQRIKTIKPMNICFADRGEECSILKEKHCIGCPFFKKAAQVDMEQIEADIVNYNTRYSEKHGEEAEEEEAI